MAQHSLQQAAHLLSTAESCAAIHVLLHGMPGSLATKCIHVRLQSLQQACDMHAHNTLTRTDKLSKHRSKAGQVHMDLPAHT